MYAIFYILGILNIISGFILASLSPIWIICGFTSSLFFFAIGKVLSNQNEMVKKLQQKNDSKYTNDTKIGVNTKVTANTSISQVNEDGDIYWYKIRTNKLHREGGLPAIERADGYKAYYVDGQLHRENGLPAVERVNGEKHYYVNGKQISEEEAKRIASNPCADNLVEIDGVKYILTLVE